MSKVGDDIEKIRAILKEYDDGKTSPAGCEASLFDVFMNPFLDAVENDPDGFITCGSCCCSAHPPDRSFTVKFTIRPHGFEAKRCT